jgi:hypothetical protein
LLLAFASAFYDSQGYGGDIGAILHTGPSFHHSFITINVTVILLPESKTRK